MQTPDEVVPVREKGTEHRGRITVPEGPLELRGRLSAEAERIEEDCAYNSVGHFSAASRWRVVDYVLGFPIAIFAGIAAFTVFTAPRVATALTVATTLLALAVLYLRPAETASLHLRSGGKSKALREKARIFREITLMSSTLPEDDLIRRLHDLAEEKRVISEMGVPLPDFAYKIAKSKIAAGQVAYDRDLHDGL